MSPMGYLNFLSPFLRYQNKKSLYRCYGFPLIFPFDMALKNCGNFAVILKSRTHHYIRYIRTLTIDIEVIFVSLRNRNASERSVDLVSISLLLTSLYRRSDKRGICSITWILIMVQSENKIQVQVVIHWFYTFIFCSMQVSNLSSKYVYQNLILLNHYLILVDFCVMFSIIVHSEKFWP